MADAPASGNRSIRSLATLAIGGVVLFAAWASGAVAGTVETLGLMGFDEPRSFLIDALTMGSVAAALAAACTGDRRSASLLGLVGLVALFGSTFITETSDALRASGVDGSFDPLGWSLSALALVVLSLVFAWAGATIALEARRALIRVGAGVAEGRRAGWGRRHAAGRLAGAAIVALILVVSFSMFSDMINFAPDTAFVRSGPPQVGLGGEVAGGPVAAPEASGDPGSGPTGDDTTPGDAGASGDPGTPSGSLPPGASPGPTPAPDVTGPLTKIAAGGTLAVTKGAVAVARPWQAGAPSGAGSTDHVTLPAPWTGGYSKTVDVYIRLPADYDAANRRYPTVYVTPSPYSAWVQGARLPTVVDSLTSNGTLPPMIYVFAAPLGGPHADTECIDSQDGTEQWDTFMSATLVQYVDAHYATMADPAARTIMGSSQGAYCAATLLLRHPDVWHQEVSFVGYYDAAPHNHWTHSGAAIFGGDTALMDQYSPLHLAPTLPADTRSHLLFVLAGDSMQQFYGPQLDTFTVTLDRAGYARAVIQTPFGHSWKTNQTYLPTALELIAERMVQQGTLQ